jgi:hypothetical protein
VSNSSLTGEQESLKGINYRCKEAYYMAIDSISGASRQPTLVSSKELKVAQPTSDKQSEKPQQEETVQKQEKEKSESTIDVTA